MKTTIALAALLLVTGVGFAQLVNPGFEQWEGDSLVGWVTWNTPYFPHVVERSDQAYSGSYAVRMMINQTTNANYIEQQIAVSNLDESVSLELHYAGLPDSTEGEITIIGYRGGEIIDAGGVIYNGHSPNYQSASAVWEPYYDDLDAIVVMLLFYAVNTGSMFDASLLIDEIVLSGVTGQKVNEEVGAGTPADWRLSGIYPNPFNNRTTVRFVSPAAASVDLAVYDLAGRRVATIANGIFTPGEHNVPWVAPDGLGAGAYIVRLNTRDRSFNTRAIFLK